MIAERIVQVSLSLFLTQRDSARRRGLRRCKAADVSGGAASEAARHYIDGFNAGDEELYPSTITNAGAWQFLQANIPLLDCPDKVLEDLLLPLVDLPQTHQADARRKLLT